MKDRDNGFLRGLEVEQARLENALEHVQQQTSRFPRNAKQERHMKRMLAHMERIEATIRRERGN